jgi:hypothetical protein
MNESNSSICNYKSTLAHIQNLCVIPAQAGIQLCWNDVKVLSSHYVLWIPACAGMTIDLHSHKS